MNETVGLRLIERRLAFILLKAFAGSLSVLDGGSVTNILTTKFRP